MKERQQFERPMPVGRMDADGGRAEQAEGFTPHDAIGNGSSNQDLWRDFIRMLRRSAEHPS